MMGVEAINQAGRINSTRSFRSQTDKLSNIANMIFNINLNQDYLRVMRVHTRLRLHARISGAGQWVILLGIY